MRTLLPGLTWCAACVVALPGIAAAALPPGAGTSGCATCRQTQMVRQHAVATARFRSRAVGPVAARGAAYRAPGHQLPGYQPVRQVAGSHVSGRRITGGYMTGGSRCNCRHGQVAYRSLHASVPRPAMAHRCSSRGVARSVTWGSAASLQAHLTTTAPGVGRPHTVVQQSPRFTVVPQPGQRVAGPRPPADVAAGSNTGTWQEISPSRAREASAGPAGLTAQEIYDDKSAAIVTSASLTDGGNRVSKAEGKFVRAPTAARVWQTRPAIRRQTNVPRIP